MALEYRNGRPYYYRKKRRGGKVISEYVGSGELAETIADFEEGERMIKSIEHQAQSEERNEHQQEDAELVKFEQVIDELFTSVALANDYHKPKRQWRKKRQQ